MSPDGADPALDPMGALVMPDGVTAVILGALLIGAQSDRDDANADLEAAQSERDDANADLATAEEPGRPGCLLFSRSQPRSPQSSSRSGPEGSGRGQAARQSVTTGSSRRQPDLRSLPYRAIRTYPEITGCNRTWVNSLHTAEVTGSKPVSPTRRFPGQSIHRLAQFPHRRGSRITTAVSVERRVA